MFEIVGKQMLVMGFYIVCGIVLYKAKMISHEGSKVFTNLLIYFIAPFVTIKSFCIERTPEKMKALAFSFLLGIGIQLFGLLLSHIIYKKKPLEEFATTYPNIGFFGIPVIQAIFGTEAVFYVVPLSFFVGSLQYSYGVYLLVGSKKALSLKRLLLAPNTIGMIVGIILFLSNLGTKIPPLANQCIDTIANLNAFCAMVALGIFLIQSDLSQLYKNIELYIISILRILVIPLICTVIFKFIPVDYNIKTAILIGFAGPVGANVANYSLMYNKDYGTASLYVATSTLLCLFTLPLYSLLLEKIL